MNDDQTKATQNNNKKSHKNQESKIKHKFHKTQNSLFKLEECGET